MSIIVSDSNKATGSEIKKFWNGFWEKHSSEEWFHEFYGTDGTEGTEDEPTEIEDLNDFQTYNLDDSDFGYVSDPNNIEIDFISMFKDWKKQQTHVQVLIAIPKELETAIKTYLEKMNVEILN